MIQPELGRKISELRKAKGLTQEELVEKCNVSVRTIQRIETGEVTPRSYTIKTILSALDYDLSQLSDHDDSIKAHSNWLKTFLLIDVNKNSQSDFLIKQLNIAWTFGILYFIMGVLEGAADYSKFKGEMLFGSTAYIIIKIMVLVSFVLFQRGFVAIGGFFENYLLTIISVVMIGANVLIIGCDIASMFHDSFDQELIIIGASILYGGLGLVYGISLRRLENSFGRIARYAGLLEILAALFFLTIALSFLGLILQIPAELFEIILLFKATEIIRDKFRQPNSRQPI